MLKCDDKSSQKKIIIEINKLIDVCVYVFHLSIVLCVCENIRSLNEQKNRREKKIDQPNRDEIFLF